MRVVDATLADLTYVAGLTKATREIIRTQGTSYPRTKWVSGGSGTSIEVMEGSRDLPSWVAAMIDRILRLDGYRRRIVRLRWRRCSRGCAHGTAYPGGRVSFYYCRRLADNEMLVMHEMAHVINRRKDKHGDGFYDCLYRIAKSEGRLREITGTRYATKAPLVRAAHRAERTAA